MPRKRDNFAIILTSTVDGQTKLGQNLQICIV
jgi:hypothetical protein